MSCRRSVRASGKYRGPLAIDEADGYEGDARVGCVFAAQESFQPRVRRAIYRDFGGTAPRNRLDDWGGRWKSLRMRLVRRFGRWLIESVEFQAVGRFLDLLERLDCEWKFHWMYEILDGKLAMKLSFTPKIKQRSR
jgi:hypothetical protein